MLNQKTLRPILSLAILIACVFLNVVSKVHAQTKLQWKFKKGQVFRHEITTVLKRKTLAGKSPYDMTMDTQFTIHLKVLEVLKNNNAKIELSFKRFKTKVTNNKEIIEFDTDSKEEPTEILQATASAFKLLVKSKFIFTITPQGNPSELSGTKVFKKELSKVPGTNQNSGKELEKMLKELIQRMIPIFPKEAIVVGKTWKEQKEEELNAGSKKVKIDFLYTYKGTGERGHQLIEFNVKPYEKKLKLPDGSVIIAKGGPGNGAIIFDNKNGHLIEYRVSKSMKTDMKTGSDPIVLSSTSTSSNKVTIITEKSDSKTDKSSKKESQYKKPPIKPIEKKAPKKESSKKPPKQD